MKNQATTQQPASEQTTAEPQIKGTEFERTGAESTTEQTQSTGAWKQALGADMANSPLLQKFDDTPDGLKKAFESHSNLEKLLGHEKVPIPKDVNDVEGWNRFSKAMGVPDKAEGYGLADPSLPDEMKDFTFDKQRFAETMHSFKLTPSQAKGLWEAYTNMNKEAYQNAVRKHQETLTNTVNELRGKWGDSYDTNVELGQMVINKFAKDKEANDFITATLTQDPRGVEFLAAVGQQFSENKIGDFGYKQFSLSPEMAQNEIDKIIKDPKHPYNDTKASAKDHQAAVDYVNSLYASVNRAKG